MSASLSQENDEKFQQALDTMRVLTEGDSVIFGDRAMPLTVVDIEGEEPDRRITLEGPRGGEVLLREDYNPNGTPKFRTDTGERANDLRFADEDDARERIQTFTDFRNVDIESSDSDPGGSTDETGSQESPPQSETPDSGEQEIRGSDDAGITELDIDIGEGEMVVSGHHADFDADFTIIYGWNSERSEWVWDAESSTIDAFSQDERFVVLQDVTSRLERDGYSVSSTPDPDEPTDPAAVEAGSQSDGTDGVSMDGWTLKADGEPVSPDEFAAEATGDFLADVDFNGRNDRGLLERTRERLFGGGEVAATWTFVDELRSTLGLSVPKLYDNYVLADHGSITDEDSFRRAIWVNMETGRVVALVSVPVDGQDTPAWAVYAATEDEVQSNEPLTPVWSTVDDSASSFEKASAAMSVVQEQMGASEVPAVELVEDTSGNVSVIDTTNAAELGRRVANAGAGAAVTTGEVIHDVTVGTISGVSNWLDQNWVKVGKVTAFGMLYSAAWVFDKYVPGSEVKPIFNNEEIGIHIQSRYESDPTRKFVRDVIAGDDVSRAERRDFQQGALRAGADFRLTIDPRQLAFAQASTHREDPVFNLSREKLVDFADRANLEDLSFQLPDGSARRWVEAVASARDDTDADIFSGTSSSRSRRRSSRRSSSTDKFFGSSTDRTDSIRETIAEASAEATSDTISDDDGGADADSSDGSDADGDGGRRTARLPKETVDEMLLKLARVEDEAGQMQVLQGPIAAGFATYEREKDFEQVKKAHLGNYLGQEFWPAFDDRLRELGVERETVFNGDFRDRVFNDAVQALLEGGDITNRDIPEEAGLDDTSGADDLKPEEKQVLQDDDDDDGKSQTVDVEDPAAVADDRARQADEFYDTTDVEPDGGRQGGAQYGGIAGPRDLEDFIPPEEREQRFGRRD